MIIHSHMSICALDGDRSLRVVIDCEPLDKRLAFAYLSFFKQTKAEDFQPKRLVKFL